ncbi:MAG: flagellar biosynthetic protein FliR [Vulcanimicrobiota bacterium]
MSWEGLTELGEDQLFMYFLTMGLCMARIMAFFVQAPIWGSKHINTKIKVGFMLALTIIVWPNIPIPHEVPGGFVTFMLLLCVQITVGLVIGFISFIPMAMAQFGGELADIQMGLSSAATQDPSSKGTVNLIRRLHFYFAMLVFMMLNGHHVLIKALVKSFDVVPLTGAQFSGKLVLELITMTGQLIEVGVQIGLPVLGALFMVQIALGIMARVAPQMNVFMLSFPINIMTGLTMLTAAMPIFLRKLGPLFEENIQMVVNAINYMQP